MYLGIEIGGTKLQLAVGRGDGSEPAELVRCEVDRAQAADGILKQIEQIGPRLVQRYDIQGVGIGFGGPVDAREGRVTTSHQVTGWDGFPLAAWCRKQLGVSAVIDNDCNVAALAEARFGAGSNRAVVFYVTVGTGVGGGLVINSQLFGSQRPAIAEIGHLRPNLHFAQSSDTVESLASGLGMVASVRRLAEGEHARRSPTRQLIDDALRTDIDWETARRDLTSRHGGLAHLTGQQVATLAGQGNPIAQQAVAWSARTLGWAIAQVITLLAPDVVIVGGGVPQMEERLFFAPLLGHVQQYVFPPLHGSYEIQRPQLGELVVAQGALALIAGTA